MNWLSPFLTPAALTEFGVVAFVFGYLCLRYKDQKIALDRLDTLLIHEQGALDAAKTAVTESIERSENPVQRAARLKKSLVLDTLVWKRARLTARNSFRRPESMLPREFVAVTDESRYWQGAFVFIGLAGTLVCLGLAVASLSFLVARNSAGSSSLASGLKEVVSHMTAVFGGMGSAFLSTASGVGFTLVLAGRINTLERGWEMLRDEIEEFSLLEIEPLAAQMSEQTEDIPRLEEAIKRMETIANGFTNGLEKALDGLRNTGEGVQRLREANEEIAKSLSDTAQTLDGASGTLSLAANSLGENLQSLKDSVTSHGEATRQWNDDGKRNLVLLREVVQSAVETFTGLNEMRRELLESTHASRELGQNVHQAHTSSMASLRDVVNSGLLGVRDAIDSGVESERRVIDQFRLVLETMGEYALRVEDSIHQLPGSVGNEPLFLVESGQEAMMGRVANGIGDLRGEMSGLSDDLRAAIVQDLPRVLGQSLSGFKNVGKDIEGLRSEMRTSSTNSQTAGENIAGLAAQVQGLNAQVAQIRASVANLDQGLVISWPRGRK